jgi:hypothetical protein
VTGKSKIQAIREAPIIQGVRVVSGAVYFDISGANDNISHPQNAICYT